MLKKRFLSTLAASLLISANLLPIAETLVDTHVVLASEQVVSVSEYLTRQANGQTVTLEGYIVNTFKSGKNFDGTTKSDTNLALADSPNETNPDKAVPIQLSKGQWRERFNIKTNPDKIGQKVRITGTSENYFTKNGIKKVTNIVLSDEVAQPVDPPATNTTTPPATTETANTEATPIQTVRQSSQDAVYTIIGKVVTPANQWGGHGFYVVGHDHAGLYVYPKNDLGYQLGDTVRLTGKLSSYAGELQLVDITQHSRVDKPMANTLFTTDRIDQLSDDKQARLITLQDVTVEAITSNTHGTATFQVKDKQGEKISVRLDSRTGVNAEQLQNKIGQGDVIHLTGVLSTYNNTKQIKPFALQHFTVVTKAETTIPSDTQLVSVGQIQGDSHVSRYNNQTVTVKNVVVTYVDGKNHFYIQDITPDSDENTSNGINVYAKNHQVSVGDTLEIVGDVTEYFGGGYAEKKQTDLSITQLIAQSVNKVGTAPVPAPIVLGKDKHVPTDVIDNDGMRVFDPQEDALDFWESLEGMLVAVDDAKILGPQAHKEVYVVPGNYQGVMNKVGGISIAKDDFNPERIPLLLKQPITVKSGDSFSGRITGPVSYSYTNYKVLVDNSTLPPLVNGSTTPEKTTILPQEDKLTIAAYNIENFSANKQSTSDEKVNRIARSFVEDLLSPDIITLVEVQDNNGQTDNGNTDATQSAARLIEAIKALGGPTYTYVDIAPENNQDGGAPGGNIRNGFLYNAERVQLSNKPKASVNQDASWTQGELTYSIARINPTGNVWRSVRKPVVAEFEFNGEKVNVIAVHLNSKRGDNGLFGRVQPVVFKSEEKRHILANVLNQFVSEGIAQNKDTNIVMLGDYNDFEFTDTMKIIEGNVMTNIVKSHDLDDRFSYFYQGNNQSLDHIVLSNNLLNRYRFDMVHVNSPFMTEHGRASDHDPLIVQLDLRKKTDEDATDAPNNASSESKETSKTQESSESKETSKTQETSSSSKKQTHKKHKLGGQVNNAPSTTTSNETTASTNKQLPNTSDSIPFIWLGLSIVFCSFMMMKKNKQ